MREIAKRVGSSTIKIYTEYGSKDALLLEVQKLGFQHLKVWYERALAVGLHGLQERFGEQVPHLVVLIYDEAQGHQVFLIGLLHLEHLSPLDVAGVVV